jgi:hypothetical protein
MDGGGGLADPAFLVDDGDDAHGTRNGEEGGDVERFRAGSP